MKKMKYLGLCLILGVGILSGCAGKTDADTTTVFVDKKGHITGVDVEKLDQDYYDEEELKNYIADRIESYRSENGNTVEETSLQVKDGVAKLKMKYDSAEDYKKFNGITFFAGTIAEAQEAGYDFDAEFFAPDEEEDEALTGVDKKDVLADDGCKVVIIKACVDVSVKGDIRYVSGTAVRLKDKNTVSVTGDENSEEAPLTYIIYQ